MAFTGKVVIFLSLFTLSVAQDPPHEIIQWPTCDPNILGGDYTLSDSKYCDRYFHCKNGSATYYQCQDGFGFVPSQGCKLLHKVNCSATPLLQPPKSSENCPRLYGVFDNKEGCGKFYKCDNGTAIPDQCQRGLMYDDNVKGCRAATKEELEKCGSAIYFGCTLAQDGVHYTGCTKWQCPVSDSLPFGDHSRHPYPGNCRYYIKCLRDGTFQIGGCQDGTAYNSNTSNCEPAPQANCGHLM